ncbi:MAG: LytR/AlgR family response regulator transcription factor [Cyclobacteriaceae bacterium]
MKLRSIIVDDEPIARRGLEEDIRQIDFIDIIGVADSSIEALKLIGSKNPDLVFLDIEMPRLNGLDLIKTLKNPPMIIITTAYSQYALKGYELDVIDYLVKPIDFNRLLKSCYKAKEFYQLKHKLSDSEKPTDHFFFVKFNGNYEKIISNEILYAEAANNYVVIHTTNKKIMTYDSLKNISNILPSDNFIRVHKSFIVAIDKIITIEKNEIHINKTAIPISRNLKDSVVKRILNKQQSVK